MRSNTLWRLAAPASVALAWSGTLGGAPALAQQPASPQPDPQQQNPPSVSEKVVVSATRVPEIETEIPGQATVITGEELRRRNARTLADALQDVVGLDTGGGSDNGSPPPHTGMWGVKGVGAPLVM